MITISHVRRNILKMNILRSAVFVTPSCKTVVCNDIIIRKNNGHVNYYTYICNITLTILMVKCVKYLMSNYSILMS